MHAYSVATLNEKLNAKESESPDVWKQLWVWREYSQRRVQSPLVELTAWHKTSCVGYRTTAPYSDTVTDMWQPDIMREYLLRSGQLCTWHFITGFTQLRTEHWSDVTEEDSVPLLWEGILEIANQLRARAEKVRCGCTFQWTRHSPRMCS